MDFSEAMEALFNQNARLVCDAIDYPHYIRTNEAGEVLVYSIEDNEIYVLNLTEYMYLSEWSLYEGEATEGNCTVTSSTAAQTGSGAEIKLGVADGKFTAKISWNLPEPGHVAVSIPPDIMTEVLRAMEQEARGA